MADRERGERIKGLRHAKAETLGRRVTQQAMADAVGVTLRGAQEWEYGGGIDDDHLPKLLKFLDTDADYLFRGSQLKETPDPFAAADDLSEIHRKLDEILKRLEPGEDAGLGGPPRLREDERTSQPGPDERESGEEESGGGAG